MIPSYVIIAGALWPVLPPGIFEVTIDEVKDYYATTPHRMDLFNGLVKGLNNLFQGGCLQVYLDGSFVTPKPKPNDYEVCWDPRFVNPSLIDPLFLDFRFGTDPQKKKYKGEYFPSSWTESMSGKTFLEFFQTEKDTGRPKGILHIKNYLKGGQLYDHE